MMIDLELLRKACLVESVQASVRESLTTLLPCMPAMLHLVTALDCVTMLIEIKEETESRK